MNKNKTTRYQDLQNVAKVVIRGKDIAVNSYIKKEDRSQINMLTFHLEKLEKEKQTKHKTIRRKEIIKNRVEKHEIEK